MFGLFADNANPSNEAQHRRVMHAAKFVVGQLQNSLEFATVRLNNDVIRRLFECSRTLAKEKDPRETRLFLGSLFVRGSIETVTRSRSGGQPRSIDSSRMSQSIKKLCMQIRSPINTTDVIHCRTVIHACC